MRALRLTLIVAALGAVALSGLYLAREHPRLDGPVAVLTVDARYPTQDKPQSKLWFAHDAWWVWLADGDASSIWRRTERGWQRQTQLDPWLRKLPGRADVWSEGQQVRAVLVADRQLASAALRFDAQTGSYQPDGAPVVWPLPRTELPPQAELASPGPQEDAAAWWAAYEKSEPAVETATIARDGDGTWWIAYDFRKSIWVRHSLDASGLRWGAAQELGGPVSPDDISVIFATPGSVGVVWGHQSGAADEAVYFRRHRDGDPPGRWGQVEIVQQGLKVAEDHLNAAPGPDGRVFVVTKDNADVIGEGQLVLRVLEPDGAWRNLPYAIRTETEMPTRPIVLVGGQPARLLLVHSLYPRGKRRLEHHIVYRVVDASLADLEREDRVLIAPKPGIDIRNATSTKQTLAQGPWLVLASDRHGNVYEGWIDTGKDTGRAARGE